MRVAGVVAMAAVLAGCTSVKLVQRDGCWVRRTEKWPKRVTEELGPCTRPAPAWAQDRHTRLVQECVAEADYRWQSRALAAWNRGEALPRHEPEADVLKACMDQAGTAMVTENEALKDRLSAANDRVSEVTKERDAVRASADADRAKERESHERLAADLGEAVKEAAKKPASPAVATATATSDGTAKTENGSTVQSASDARPTATAPLRAYLPAEEPGTRGDSAATPRRARTPKKDGAALMRSNKNCSDRAADAQPEHSEAEKSPCAGETLTGSPPPAKPAAPALAAPSAGADAAPSAE